MFEDPDGRRDSGKGGEDEMKCKGQDVTFMTTHRGEFPTQGEEGVASLIRKATTVLRAWKSELKSRYQNEDVDCLN